MLDISRNFHRKTEILTILEVMARYKLNKLHLHLTDDEGWRLEIPGLEELTTFGGLRCHDTGMCLAPQIGSGAKSDTSGSGSLTVRDYQDILRHAKTLHIEIIPEFDMPGHSHAAIKAMEYRFRKHNASSNETVRRDASKFLLAEPDDPSKYFSVQMFRDNAVNPCLNSTYNFIEHVLSALVNLHKDISPLKLFHMGGDEVAKGAWINSTACKKLTTQNTDIDSLKKYFATRLSEIVAKYNISFAAWEDGLFENNELFNKTELSKSDVYSYAWDNVWEWGKFDRAYRFANAGYKTVLGHATHLYFDMPYEPDPEERGFYWATRFTDTKKTFGYMPDSVYDNAKEDRFGNPLDKDELCEKQNSCPTLLKKSNIVGIQGHLWSETVRDKNQLFHMCFPRVLALAERAWHKAEFEKDGKLRKQKLEMEWQAFANLLGYQELRKLDELGVTYRVPLPGAKIESGKLVASSVFPGLKIEYSISGQWKEYTAPVASLSGNVKLRTSSADGKRTSREINVEVPDVPVGHGSRNAAAFLHLLFFLVIFSHNFS
jgi:hexosaminidase